MIPLLFAVTCHASVLLFLNGEKMRFSFFKPRLGETLDTATSIREAIATDGRRNPKAI